MKYGCLFIFLAFFISCKSTKPVSELTEDDIQITLRKGGCFGSCPVYSFNVYDGGYCTFIGEMNTEKIGTYSKQIEKEVYKELINSFEDADFHNFDDMYESNIPDLPLITMSYNNGKSVKTIKGKRERPTILHRLQFKLEKIAESDKSWTLISEKTVDENQGPKYNKAHIVLNLRHGSQLASWFNKMRKEHGVRILKKLSNDEDSWLISYNLSKYSPEEMLELLRNDPNVESAEFSLEI